MEKNGSIITLQDSPKKPKDISTRNLRCENQIKLTIF